MCSCVCSRENICPGVGGGLGRRGQVQAAGVCRVKGLQLLIAGWYTDTDGGGGYAPTFCTSLDVTDGARLVLCK